MVGNSKDASHAAIWDDSMLVNSWNEALEEYKQYHSIQARGENPEDVLKAHEDDINGVTPTETRHDKVVGQNVNSDDDSHAKPALANETADHSKVETNITGQENVPAMPQHLIGQVHDENMKNLLMSWYYAGYYTGLYEGKQQGAPAKEA